MATSSENDDVVGRWRRFLGAFLKAFNRPARGRGGGRVPTIDLWGESTFWGDNEKLREAILSLRMVANRPGESYEEIAARVDQEAANFEAFQRNPTPIGKISLNTKWVTPDASGREFLTKMYQVRDPDRGHASVNITLESSARLVLEFLVYDEDGRPLFPLLRTYSNWTGEKSFDLGLGRTFTLKMKRAAGADGVRVSAGFASPQGAEDDYTVPVAAFTNGTRNNWGDGFTLGFERRIACLVFAQCLAVAILFAWAFFNVTTSQPAADRAVIVGDEGGANAFYATTVGFAVDAGGGTAGAAAPDQPVGAAGAKTLKTVQAALSEAHPVGGGHAARETDRRCSDLVVNFRKAVNDIFQFIPVSAPDSGPRVTAQTDAAAKETADGFFGHMSVTFITPDGLMQVREPGCLRYVEGKADGFLVSTPLILSGSLGTEPAGGGEVPRDSTATEGQKPEEAATMMRVLDSE